MPLPFALPALGMLIPAKVKRIAIIAGMVVFVALASGTLGYCKGHSAGRAQMELALAKANELALQEKGRADGLAAERRLQDTMSINRNEEALRDAIAATPDSAPDAVRVRLACARLRASGQDTARIPSCR